MACVSASAAAVSAVHQRGPQMRAADSWSSRCRLESSTSFVTPMELLSPAQVACGKFLDSSFVNGALVALIVFSFVIVIIEADYKGDPPFWIWASNIAILCSYIIEAAMRMYVMRSKYFCSAINILDFILIIADITSETMVALGHELMPSFIILRVVRLTRLFRSVKALVKFPQLALLVKGFINSLGAVAYGVAFMCLNLLFWSVGAVYFIHPVNKRVALAGKYMECDRCEHAFETVMESTLTFVQQIICGDSWGEITIPIINESPATAVFFAAVFTSIHIMTLNLILAVIVDTALKTSLECNEEVVKHKMSAFTDHANHLKAVCRTMDRNCSGDVTFDELVEGYDTNETFRNLLNAMDVNKSDLALIFAILDTDGSGAVNNEEFISEIFKMKSQDSHTLLVFIKHYVCDIRKDVRKQMRSMRSLGAPRRSSEPDLTQSEILQGKLEAMILGTTAPPGGGLGDATSIDDMMCIRQEGIGATKSTEAGLTEPEVLECSGNSLLEELRRLQESLRDDLMRGMQELSQKAERHERLLASMVGGAPVLCGRMQEAPWKAGCHDRLLAPVGG
eukprot:CAMPEP_0171265486 /NCGR_PEP_ID=MMETSP0790-20130122/58149_1 /TAXON_ID=2925 /ORGANISM="Alexandrium catenella, Strain OF101" /LENGTH=566 /DNA_ID=CAMNT_0011734155 /DNA_START=71 /DNA_END=1768 /DNA_ORIENTATION=+